MIPESLRGILWIYNNVIIAEGYVDKHKTSWLIYISRPIYEMMRTGP
jgi:hypothetical protein